MADPVETMETVTGFKAVLQKAKGPLLFYAWILGLMIVGSLVWILIRPALSENLMRDLNYSLAAQGETQFLSYPIHNPVSTPAPRGIWFAYSDSPNIFFAFTILHDGIMIPCGTQITSDGKVAKFFLLSEHARQVYERLPQGIVMLYADRIEKALEGRGAK